MQGHKTWGQWGMAGVALALGGLGLGVALAQQPSPPAAPVPCQTQLAQALQRAINQQALATQEREALASYFQGQLELVNVERDTLKKQLDEVKNGHKE